MKRLIFLFVILCLANTAFAQLEVRPGSFHKVDGFVNINMDKQTDDNDQPYAVLKVRTENIDGKQRRDFDATTPYSNNMIPSGKYEITVSKDRYKTVTKIVDVADGDKKNCGNRDADRCGC